MPSGPDHYRHAEEMAGEAAERLKHMDWDAAVGVGRCRSGACHAGERGGYRPGRPQPGGQPGMAEGRRDEPGKLGRPRTITGVRQALTAAVLGLPTGATAAGGWEIRSPRTAPPEILDVYVILRNAR